jgi:formylglycine-generating enzyme required for sulfatase activity
MTTVSPPKSLVNSIGMTFALIPAGTFLMGSPQEEKQRSKDEEQHEVEITRPFYLGVFEVTQKQWREVMGSNPSSLNRDRVGSDTDDCPVESVSWHDAVAFCEALSSRPEEKAAGRKSRLPAEAEWEYACRGGAVEHQAFHYGNSLSSTQANFNGDYPYGGATRGAYLERTTKVGSYEPNAYGLYDMHGNVWEWCSDWYGNDYYKKSPRRDPTGPAEGTSRVVRGGSWDCFGQRCRSAWRNGTEPANRYEYLGFRVALVAAE